MTKKYEVEYRALLSVRVFTKLLTTGKTRHAKTFLGPIKIEDTYFCPQYIKNFSEIEMDEVGSFSLRLRRVIKGGEVIATLNVKIIKNKGDHNAWLEHEINISSYEECKKILEAIGFKNFFELTKDRYTFKDGLIQVCLEDIKDFRPAIEIEIITSKEKTGEAKNKLLDYFEENHIEKDSLVDKSITNMLMRKKASF